MYTPNILKCQSLRINTTCMRTNTTNWKYKYILLIFKMLVIDNFNYMKICKVNNCTQLPVLTISLNRFQNQPYILLPSLRLQLLKYCNFVWIYRQQYNIQYSTQTLNLVNLQNITNPTDLPRRIIEWNCRQRGRLGLLDVVNCTATVCWHRARLEIESQSVSQSTTRVLTLYSRFTWALGHLMIIVPPRTLIRVTIVVRARRVLYLGPLVNHSFI